MAENNNIYQYYVNDTLYSVLGSAAAPIPVIDSANNQVDNPFPFRFKARLYSDYQEYLILPEHPKIPEGSRWVRIETEEERCYQVEIVDCRYHMSLQRGWKILAAVENFEEGQRLMFEAHSGDEFDVWIYRPQLHEPPIGFTPARTGNSIAPQYIVNDRTELTPAVYETIDKVWAASSDDGPLYVCKLLTSPTKGKCLIFNKVYTALTPKKNSNVAMRYVGSDVIFPGAMKTYTDGNARMVKEWPLYAQHHGLKLGEVLVCKIQRGPAVWEFIASSTNNHG